MEFPPPPMSSPLQIGMVAPPWVPVPPPKYGGTELVVDVLARGLAQRGHEVILFATGDSTCPVKRAWVYDEAVPANIGTTAIEVNHAAGAYDMLSSCDVVHDHTLAGLFIGQLRPDLQIVTTNHGPFVDLLNDVYRRTSSTIPLVAISADQASRAPDDIPIAAVIHHGLDLSRYPFSATGGDYLVTIGRMHPDKGIDRAIDAARHAGVPLQIAAKMREPEEQRYFAEVIRPLLGRDIEYVGEVDHAAKVDLLGGAMALLNPIRWAEPFGLVMIEALACGTPVIATHFGAAPELVEHELTGYLASTPKDLVKAINSVDRIERLWCRAAAVDRFSMERMAAEYEAVFLAAVQGSIHHRAGEVR